jgi:hypothetical protein
VAASSSLGGELALAAKSVPGRNENLRKIVTLRSQRVNEKQPQAVVEICHCGKIDIAGQKAEALQPLEESNAGVKLCCEQRKLIDFTAFGSGLKPGRQRKR